MCLSDLSCAVYNASDFGAGEQLPRRTGASVSPDEVALFTTELREQLLCWQYY